MYFCYVDESGTPEIPGTSSHCILAGLSIPVSSWKGCDESIESIKERFGLAGQEIHVAWLLRPYLEQRRIANFGTLSYEQRRSQVQSYRTAELLQLQRSNKPKRYKQRRKDIRQTSEYVHLTEDERKDLVRQLAICVARWDFARLFAECVDKVHFDPVRARKTIAEQCFEQVVSRFEEFLQSISRGAPSPLLGLLIHDNNPTVAANHTALMNKYHKSGTLWTQIHQIIETPLFVDSQLTGMVQIADLCAYALRRYVENGEADLFDMVFQRADRKDGVVVGVRHFSKPACQCKICKAHRKP